MSASNKSGSEAGGFRHPRQVADATPDKPALIMAGSGEVLTYRELADRSAQAAHLFAICGLQQGDTIAVLMENHIRYPEICWAGKDSGLRYVAINAHLNAADAAFIVKDSGARLLLVSEQKSGLACEIANLLDNGIDMFLVDGRADGFRDYERDLAVQPTTPLTDRCRGASMLYSSGTTGRPKGIETPISPAALPEDPPPRHFVLVSQYGIGADCVFLDPAPFYHAAPLRMMFCVQRSGGTVIGMERFDTAGVLDAIERYQVTHGFFVPTMFKRLLALPEETRAGANTETLRHVIHGAAPCPRHIKQGMIDWWGPCIAELYGGTESIGYTFITSAEWLKHPGSVGKAPDGCTIRIVDDAGTILPPHSPGLVQMSNGRQVRYHGEAAKESGALLGDDGFGSLGDIGYLDEDGYLFLTDRQSHMIVRGGVNIYPQEAEAVLERHPAVADIAVIGVPDDEMGEDVKAIVELNAGFAAGDALAAELISFCQANLSKQKCPRSIDFSDALPRNDLGKLVKHKLRDNYWAAHKRRI